MVTRNQAKIWIREYKQAFLELESEYKTKEKQKTKLTFEYGMDYNII